MRYLSVCSGIEAATAAWHGLGWEPVAFSEIEAFPSAVLAHHYPNVPNWGDMTKYKEWPDACYCGLEPASRQGHGSRKSGRRSSDAGRGYADARNSDMGGRCSECGRMPVDLLVGGTPCQSFSVAGLRKGLADPRGNLMLTYLAIADRYRPRWLVWENVPGVLSSGAGRDFGAFLGGLGQLGYGWAYRILDAQYAGVPQRRRRVFVVGHLGDWHAAAAVLFERHSLQGHSPPRREAGERVAPTVESRANGGGGGWGTDFMAGGGMTAFRMQAFGEYEADGTASALKRRDYKDATDLVAHSLRTDGLAASEDGTGRGTPLVPVQCNGSNVGTDLPCLRRGDGGLTSGVPAIGFRHSASICDGNPCLEEATPTLRKGDDGGQAVLTPAMSVRRLTPRECERLMGFPDDFTLIPYRGKPAADGPRYKAIGNSFAVPVVRWIGQRIQAVEDVLNNDRGEG